MPRLICIIGAESTGKTTLARALSAHFDCPWVREYLRDFCESRRRTPTQDEQSLILETQLVDETAALVNAREHKRPFVFCDTAPLLTAIYSDIVFGDKSLYTRSRTLHARYAITLLLEPDIPWQADGLQRDGAHVREPVTDMIERELVAMSAAYVRVGGDRLDAACRLLTARVDVAG